jgi:hypothetical protein
MPLQNHHSILEQRYKNGIYLWRLKTYQVEILTLLQKISTKKLPITPPPPEKGLVDLDIEGPFKKKFHL